MRLRWDRIVTLLLLLVGLLVFVLHGDAVGRVIEGISSVFDADAPGGRLRSFVAFCVLSVSIVAIVKLLSDANRK